MGFPIQSQFQTQCWHCLSHIFIGQGIRQPQYHLALFISHLHRVGYSPATVSSGIVYPTSSQGTVFTSHSIIWHCLSHIFTGHGIHQPQYHLALFIPHLHRARYSPATVSSDIVYPTSSQGTVFTSHSIITHVSHWVQT